MPPARKRTRSANTDDQPSGKKRRLAATPSTVIEGPGSAATSKGRRGRSASGTKTGTTTESAYDFPGSDAEGETQNTPTKQARSSATRITRPAHELPGSEDELATPIIDRAYSPKQAAQQSSAKGSSNKRRGRPAKGIDIGGSELVEDELAAGITNGSTLKRGRRTSKNLVDEIPETDQEDLVLAATPAPAPRGGRRTSKTPGDEKPRTVEEEFALAASIGAKSTTGSATRSLRKPNDAPENQATAPTSEAPVDEGPRTVEEEFALAATKAAESAADGSGSRSLRKPNDAPENQTLAPSRAASAVKLTKKPSIWEMRRALTRGQPLPGTSDTPIVPTVIPDLAKPKQPQASAPNTTPGGRKRHADKGTEGDTPKLKGILTPSRKDGTPRARKSVAFNKGVDKGGEVFFADLPSKSAGKKAMKSPKESSRVDRAAVDEDGDTRMQEDEDAEEEEEEVCSICKKPDSKEGNEIIFCDGCDMAVHQKCYNVPTIPEGDWLCRTCSQDTLTVQQDPTGKSSPQPATEHTPDIPDFEQHLRLMQRVLIDRCTGRSRIPLRGQEEAYEKAFHVVEQTVLAGEGNSMLVIGARGSGKTAMVETIISKMATEHKDEFHVVRLNGFIHTDDKIALKEIWRQLGKEMEVEDDLINKTNNYADTLASLLAVLSHPSEILETEQGVTSKSVIFIIDEFDLFATHARQTLLYNLFDIAQARKAPIAVLGLTTRIDVVESLEKRVKSRFSHRYVYLSLAKSLPEYWSICRQGLQVEKDDLSAAGFDAGRNGLDEFLLWWDQRIQALRKDPAFQDHLEYHFHSSKSVPAFLTSCIPALASLSRASPVLKPHFVNLVSGSGSSSNTLEAPDSKLHLLPSLSDLDLSLLVAAARLDIVAHTDTVNFAMAYDEYTSLMGRQRVASASSGLVALGGGARVWGRGVAGVGWERLVALGLLVPAGYAGRGGGGGGAAAGAGLEGKMWKVDVALEEIPGCVKLNPVLARWCREI